MNGWDCCTKVFDPTPYFTAQGQFYWETLSFAYFIFNCSFYNLNFLTGVCFSTRGAQVRNQIVQAGDANSFTVVTMHDSVSPFDSTFLSSKLIGAQGM